MVVEDVGMWERFISFVVSPSDSQGEVRGRRSMSWKSTEPQVTRAWVQGGGVGTTRPAGYSCSRDAGEGRPGRGPRYVPVYLGEDRTNITPDAGPRSLPRPPCTSGQAWTGHSTAKGGKFQLRRCKAGCASRNLEEVEENGDGKKEDGCV